MKKKIAVFRFGSLRPTQADWIAVAVKLGLDLEAGEVLGCPMPGGMVSLIHTDKTVAEVKQAFVEAAEEIEDTLPIIVLDEAGLEGTHLVDMGFEDFAKMNGVFDLEHGKAEEGKSCTMSLDELLDLVNQVGVAGLDAAQIKRLHELSQSE